MASLNLENFECQRVLNEDPQTHTVTLLGTLPPPPSSPESPRHLAIIRIEKTALPSFSDTLVSNTKLIESTDIYSWFFGWLRASENNPDVKINVICPATEVHIRKYSNQLVRIVKETPELYGRIVKPYIDAFPASRTKWVENVICGRSESEKVVYKSPPDDPMGFLIIPDMKWDLATVSSLYLIAITLFKDIRSLRDLTKKHVSMLKNIRRQAHQAVKDRWGLEATELRLFVHYQPSYYHFHVHIVNANYSGLTGMAVGQAHMLDDIISLLEVDGSQETSIFQRMTLSYGLGEQHGLYVPMIAAQEEIAR
ncbi:scavenger mRNA decapping enzyme [Amylostereum chailletii]|nr:scavenger mRNA decapping enzyme [Amylostereum chailletii]